ncbi:signal peptide peptidase-domain-containing protein [Schizophyllum amplum]|uniref:Signal peptide peptidase-domain-containing protein n=1 Tax=Schizophyllum amplum TaxID=97359 RepID=A0A550CYF3_9AGAR|nr:signal peptide peptidase-domain-containing protein [Auriculariopsis ampla]
MSEQILQGPDWDLLSSYAGLLTLAVSCIYAGSFGSLPGPKKLKDDDSNADKEYEDEEEDGDITERMSSEDAYLFPILGSVVLFSLYLVVKFLGTEWINLLLGWYFSLAGVGAVWKSLTSCVRSIVGERAWKAFDRFELTQKSKGRSEVLLSWRTPSVALLPFSAAPSIVYRLAESKSVLTLMANTLAIAFCFTSLTLLKLDSFKTGSILLGGLFLYDIWWVFGTEVMVKVATSLDVPIKLLWPKSLLFSGERGYTMLGLGDVVIPGVFIALALRYDFVKAGRPRTSYAKPYFTAAIIAYVLGLTTTMVVMHTFKAAQPALLYLSPACVLSFVFTGLARGELQTAWAWSDEPEEGGRDDQRKKE